MITQRFLNVYGVIGIVLMAVAFLLLWLRVLPSGYYVPLLIFAFLVWTSRLVMRVMLARRERREKTVQTNLSP